MGEKSTMTESVKSLTLRQSQELAALAELPDELIDTSDIPEQRDWSGVRRRVFHKASPGAPQLADE